MIGKVIVSLLKANDDLTALVPEASIYPYVINENTALPAIVYVIESLTAEYTKDGWAGDACTFSVISFSDNYASLQNIVDEIRTALELKKGVIEDITYQQIYLTGHSEGFNITENVFLNKSTFSTYITSY